MGGGSACGCRRTGAAADRSGAGQERGGYPYTADEQTLADYDALVAGLSERPLAYLHLRGRAPAAPGAGPDFDAIARYRKLFGGPLIANHGFGRATGNAIVGAGIADAVSFARLFIANPDLVSRFALGGDLAASDRSTHYRGGAARLHRLPDVGAFRGLALSRAPVPAGCRLLLLSAFP